MARLFTVALFMAMLTHVALSCSCFEQTFEERFCGSTLSIRAKVLAKFDNCPGTCDPIEDQFEGKFFFIVKVLETFKGPSAEDNIIFLDTAVNDGLCGVNLSIGSEYLLNLNGEQMSNDGTCPKKTRPIGLCDFPTLWSNVSQDEKDFLDTPTC
ncbi:unnamed protein product [Chondrus crispus]|uniref:NTR domain-containing protein n=1 Tax=Chondrus crispus TaxID=2769 RepID=R7QIH7_CHOCR|nr:unnamed protein product [Chondrus crispus]CDF37538.1 unnamed protein product [Chondrus crispus]|eukprot:XP_005717409.1 unnamed protein product [Chondrus crispus]